MEPDQLTHRSRTGWVVLAGVLTEVAIVAGVGNQGVSGAINHYLDSPNRTFPDYSRGLLDAATAFAWRLSPASNQPTHVWAAELAAIGVLLAVSALGMLAVVRGSITFVRVWVAVWAVVAAVAPLAIMAHNLITTPSAPGPEQSRFGQAVYYAPALGTVVVAGLAIGLLAGLACAIVAVSTRREVTMHAQPAPMPEVEGELSITEYQPPPPWPPVPPEPVSAPPLASPEQWETARPQYAVTEALTWPEAPIQRQTEHQRD